MADFIKYLTAQSTALQTRDPLANSWSLLI